MVGLPILFRLYNKICPLSTVAVLSLLKSSYSLPILAAEYISECRPGSYIGEGAASICSWGSSMRIARARKEQEKEKAIAQVFKEEVAIVTGASSGIGAATAVELARRGATVVLAARRVSELEAQARRINCAGYHAVAIPTDITNAMQVTRLVKQTADMFGRVDVLVNNAGIGWLKPLIKSSMDEMMEVVDVNLLGAMFMTHAVLPGMLERRHGAIIFVASVSAHIAIDPLYSATKFGLRGFSLALHREVARHNISVSLVSPGFIRTAMSKNTPLSRQMQQRLPGPELVARTIVDLLIRPRREVIVPEFYSAFIGIEWAFPGLADLFIRLSRL